MIRVLNITSTPSAAGGAERLLLDMARHHDAANFAISYCNLFFDDSTFAQALRDEGQEVTTISGSRYRAVPTIVANLVRHLKAVRPDIVHTHMFHASLAGQMAATLAGIDTRVVTRHYLDDILPAGRRAAEHIALRRASAVIAVSEAVSLNLRAAGVEARRVTVIPNGVDLKRFDRERALPVEPPWPADWTEPLLIGSVGNLFAYKGYDVLLEAFALVRGIIPGARLVIAGDGRERDALAALAEDLGIASSVILAGRRADVPALLRSFSVYVQPSLSESSGIAAAEAMAARLPVVASTAGGLPELIGHGDTGLLIPPGDAGALAGAILRIAGDREEAHLLGERARRRIETNFSVEATVRRTESVYRALVDRPA